MLWSLSEDFSLPLAEEEGYRVPLSRVFSHPFCFRNLFKLLFYVYVEDVYENVRSTIFPGGAIYSTDAGVLTCSTSGHRLGPFR